MHILYTKTKVDTPENVEGENLGAHVILCRERAAATHTRMSKIEEKMNTIEQREEQLRSYILKTITTAAIALLSSAVSVGVMFSHYIKN